MKRVLYILGVFFVSLLLVLIMLVAVLTSDKVETSAVQLVTAEFSRALGTEARVGKVEYRFPARVSIRDIYLEDKQQDTLAYIGEIYAHFSPLALRHGEIRFSHVRLRNVVAKLYETNGEWNYQFMIDAFRSEEEKQPSDPFRSLLSVRDIQLDSIRVQYADYTLQLPHAQMDLNQLSEQLLDAQIRHLALQITNDQSQITNHQSQITNGRSPFMVNDLQARLILNDSALSMPTLKAQMPRSKMDLSGVELRFPAQDTIYLSKSAHEITFALNFRKADVVPADLSLFIPRLKGFKRPLSLSGALGGTLDSICFDNGAVRYDGTTLIEGNISAVGLPDMTNTYLRANLKDAHVNAAQLQDFISQLKGRPVRLPRALHRLGDVHYRGLAEGQLHDITLHGGFTTALGSISTNGTIVSDSTFENVHYDARVLGRKFRLGRLVNNKQLGTVTLDLSAKGGIEDGVLSGDIKAHVRQLQYGDYTYNDLHIDGRYEPQLFRGRCSIDDPHLTMAFDGVVNLKEKDPEMNFNLLCRHFDLAPFNEAHDPVANTSFSLAVDLNGAKVDEISGYMVIDSLEMATVRDSIFMQQLTFLLAAEPDMSKQVTLRSDNLKAEMNGVFRYGDMAPAFQAMLHHYLPSVVDAPARAWQPVSFSLQMEGERLRDVQRLYQSRFTLSDHPTMQADVRLAQKKEPYVDFRFFAPGIRAGNTPVHDLTVMLSTIDTLRHSSDKSSGLSFTISAEAMETNMLFTTLAFRDTLLSHLTMRRPEQTNELLPEGWEQLTPRELRKSLRADLTKGERLQLLMAAQRAGDYGGDIRCVTHFAKYNKKPLVSMHFMPGKIELRDSLYTLAESQITYCAADTSLQIKHFAFEGGGQHIYANGLASTRRTDTLSVDLQRVDASYVVPFVLPVQTIMFNGLLTGKADITGVFRQPLVETQIHVDSMGLNNCYFGDAEVDLYVYPKQQIHDSVLPPRLRFHADVYRPDRKNRNVVTLDGRADFAGLFPWELDMQTDSVPLDFINHWTYSVLKDLDGHGTGHVVVGGRKKLVYVLLQCEAQDASLTLPWTDTRYTIHKDTIIMDTTAILFPDVHLVDGYGNPVEVNGGVYHNQFKDFNLDIHVDAHDAMVFNETQPGMLQGTVFATGHVDVTGPDKDILVQADARTSKNSSFRLSIDNASSAYESNFIHFVQHDTAKIDLHAPETDLDNIDNKDVAKIDTSYYRRTSRCMLKLNLDINPHLLFQLVLGERNGDRIQGRGNGALRLTYDTQTSDVTLQGTYDIEQGSLSYTVANMIRKDFSVGDGSKIVFSGDPANPMLDVTAKYRVVANLKDLFGDDVEQVGTTRSNIPVLTCLHLTNTLQNPILSFSLEFPLSDQNIQQQVRQIINTDEMLMRQVIYLLVFGRFFTPDYMANAQYATLNSTYSLLSSTVTGQINAWLSKLTDMLTLGVAIRTEGQGDNSSQEYEANFQLQPVDRLIINGNFGYRYNDVSNQPFFGDLDVEVLLTDDGQWRLKGYTHTVDKYSLRQATTIQGVGFVWKFDF